MKRNLYPLIAALLFLLTTISYAQTTIDVNVNASGTTQTMPPLWSDHYENHLMFGYGGNPTYLGTHTPFVTDPNFYTELNKLKMRFIRISIGRADNPPDTSYYSTNTTVLKNLPYEFYKGGNNLTAANDLSNYDFSFIDSSITLVQSLGAEPFITMDYMPFNLSSSNTKHIY